VSLCHLALAAYLRPSAVSRYSAEPERRKSPSEVSNSGWCRKTRKEQSLDLLRQGRAAARFGDNLAPPSSLRLTTTAARFNCPRYPFLLISLAITDSKCQALHKLKLSRRFARGAFPTFLRGLMERKPRTLPYARLRGTRLTAFAPRNAHYSPHSHAGLTTHLILSGSLTIKYPREPNAEKVTYGVGDRVDVDACKLHEVWIGSKGCTYVIGE
jgi:hypothetical protein